MSEEMTVEGRNAHVEEQDERHGPRSSRDHAYSHGPVQETSCLPLSAEVSQEDIFSLDGVSFSYPALETGSSRREVLRDVVLGLRPGCQLGLFGPNGSGKTTLFRLITGLLSPTKGRVLFHGAPVPKGGFRPLRLAVGFVLQNADDQLFFPTVIEDVAFGPLNLGMGQDEAMARAEETLRSLGLENFGNRLTHRLSGGEKKLVTLAAVLSMRPEALLLDEPTGGLDQKSRERLIDILRHLPTARITISHDWDFLAAVSSSFCTIAETRLSWQAPLVAHSHVHAHPCGGYPHEHGAEG